MIIVGYSVLLYCCWIPIITGRPRARAAARARRTLPCPQLIKSRQVGLGTDMNWRCSMSLGYRRGRPLAQGALEAIVKECQSRAVGAHSRGTLKHKQSIRMIKSIVGCYDMCVNV
eukprot:9491090-Pyramimonas_sp.AAC.1